MRLPVASILGACLLPAAEAAQPNPPNWPDSVKIYDTSSDLKTIQADVDEAWQFNGFQNTTPDSEPGGRFSDKRFTFMFKPGKYMNLNVSIGYYMHVIGIGATPDEVIFEGNNGPHVPCDIPKPQPGQLVTFWRGAERFKRIGNMDWLVSQAAWVRDVHVTGDLILNKGGAYASGGYLGNSIVEGEIVGGGQQQWFTRNSRVATFTGVGWSAVMVGVESTSDQANLKESTCAERSTNTGQRVIVPEAPRVAEKPFISVDPNDATKFNLNVPQPRDKARGPDWSTGKVIPFENVYVTQPGDTAATINAHMDAGLSVVVAPGIYALEESLKITKSDTVILCLGLSTLLSTVGNAVITVAPGLEGVRIGGCVLEAGQQRTDALLQWGDGTHTEASTKPGFMHDLFARVGGPGFNGDVGNTATADVMVRIDADDVMGDNLWLWRADHYEAASSYATEAPDLRLTYLGDLQPQDHGIVVKGDRVRIYHLAVEHCLKDNTVWEGEDGEVYFYQNELPYEVMVDWGEAGYVAYRVAHHVRRHETWGVGAYTYFRDAPVWMASGISAPKHLVDKFHYPFIIKLSAQGGTMHVINDKGPGTAQTKETYAHDYQFMCDWQEDYRDPHDKPGFLRILFIILAIVTGVTFAFLAATYAITKKDDDLEIAAPLAEPAS